MFYARRKSGKSVARKTMKIAGVSGVNGNYKEGRGEEDEL